MVVESDAFGTLSFDEDGDEFGLEPEFESLYAAFWATRSAYVASRISHTAAAERFRALRLRTVSGEEWTLGATSSSWFSRSSGGRWEKSSIPPIGAVPDRGSLPSWVTQGIESLSSENEVAQKQESSSFNPFQRKSQPLLETGAGSIRPKSESDLDWVYEDWDEDADFSSGSPASIDPASAIDVAAADSPPVERVREESEGFDLDSLFVKPE